MLEIVGVFQRKTKELIVQLTLILEDVESDPSQFARLEEFGQIVDRIMGGAKTVALQLPDGHAMHLIGSFSEFCKSIGYKASQVTGNPEFISIVTALLLDATEMLDKLNEDLTADNGTRIERLLSQTFLNRLRFIETKFDENLRGTVSPNKGAGQNTHATASLESDLAALLAKMRRAK